MPTDETNLIARSMAHAFASKKIPMPGIHLEAHNVIPHGRGLGSSGAAIVSGVMAAKGLLEGIAEFSASELACFGHRHGGSPRQHRSLTLWGPHHCVDDRSGSQAQEAQRAPRGVPRGGRSRRRQHVDPVGAQSSARDCSSPGRHLQPFPFCFVDCGTHSES